MCLFVHEVLKGLARLLKFKITFASMQINELADIARCIANTNAGDGGAAEYLISCLQDLQDALRNNKVVALTVDTFGRRIEKLCM